MDYRIYHAINQFVYQHAWLGRQLSTVEEWAVPVVAIATFGLGFSPDPAVVGSGNSPPPARSGRRPWRSLINQAIGKVWHRQRPFAAHPAAHVWAAAPMTPRSQAITQAPLSRSHSPSSSSTGGSAPSSSQQPQSSALAASSSESTTPSTFLRAAPSASPRRSFCARRKTTRRQARPPRRARHRSAPRAVMASTPSAMKPKRGHTHRHAKIRTPRDRRRRGAPGNSARPHLGDSCPALPGRRLGPHGRRRRRRRADA